MTRSQAGRAVLIAGPTASGKSALAMRLARETGGAVINADSMQVYRDLRVLTARPRASEENEVLHRLYGHVDAAVNYSAGAYLADAARVLAEMREAARVAIVVGGTGLYFKALTRGLSTVPPIADTVRDEVRRRLAADGAEAMHATLAARDPVSAARLSPRDRTRIARALEVVESTGRSLADWHRSASPPLLAPGHYDAIFLSPDRDTLYARIDERFGAMLDAGALDEVAALRDRNLDPLLPAMKAHGVPALIRHLDGEITRDQAADIGRIDTRRYAKRQFTWFRHQLPEFDWIAPPDADAWLADRCVTARRAADSAGL